VGAVGLRSPSPSPRCCRPGAGTARLAHEARAEGVG